MLGQDTPLLEILSWAQSKSNVWSFGFWNNMPPSGIHQLSSVVTWLQWESVAFWLSLFLSLFSLFLSVCGCSFLLCIPDLVQLLCVWVLSRCTCWVGISLWNLNSLISHNGAALLMLRVYWCWNNVQLTAKSIYNVYEEGKLVVSHHFSWSSWASFV